MTFKSIVNLEVRDNVQALQYVKNTYGVSARGCSHVVVTGNEFRGARSALVDRGENVDLRQSGNAIGNPLRIEPPTSVPGPTPIPVR
jgi:hypothetical protein